jgi:DNA (cytosine-5)-methyltransferase 1
MGDCSSLGTRGRHRRCRSRRVPRSLATRASGFRCLACVIRPRRRTTPKLAIMSATLGVIDLFAGCGGLTSGFVSTGRFRPVAAVERDLVAAATYAHNFGDHIDVEDITEWSFGSMPRAHVVVGGPPCQGFSNLGKRDRRDPRNALWADYVRVVRRVRPAFFVLENVPQFLVSDQYRSLSSETARDGSLSEYRLEASVVNAADFGVAQRRRRALVIGRRRGLDPIGSLPHGRRQVLSDVFPAWLEPTISATDLPVRRVEFRGASVPGLYKLPDLHVTRRHTELSMRRFRSIPMGGSRLDLPDELKARCWRDNATSAGDVMGRLRWDRPAVTIRTACSPEKGRYLHPEEHRAITPAEAALIQGFPEDFVWCGSKASVARQIGNAVPPPLAAVLAQQLADRIA